MHSISFNIPRGWRPTMAVVALALSLAACSGKEEDATPADSPVAAAPPAIVLGPQDVMAAQVAEIGSAITLSGPLEPKERVTLRAQVAGTVADLRVDRGSTVRQGQRLATIRAVGVQSQAAGARAGLAAAQANLAVAKQRLEAARTLREAGAMSAIDFRSAQAAYESAEAQVAAARAMSASAGETAGFTVITSPIAGVVSDRKVQEGESVSNGGELLTVVNSRVLELAGQIGVGEASLVRPGQRVSFTLDAFPSREFTGRVARVDPTADPGTRQVGVYVELANPTGAIIGGQFARGQIATTAIRALVVPSSAVQGADANGANAHVFVVEGGKVARKPVTLGARDESSGRVAIMSGLREGEQVIVNPTSDIAVGAAVTIASDQPAGATPAAAAPAAR